MKREKKKEERENKIANNNFFTFSHFSFLFSLVIIVYWAIK